MIYCVVPEEMADELYDRLKDYYADDPNVTVIVDRRKSSRRSPASGGGGQRERRDRRRSRVAGVSRSLGAPEIGVRTSEVEPSVISIFVMWELSWYRFEVDLSDEAGGARRVAQGAELSELEPEERVVNAVADDRGRIALASG